ncbi:MAG: hypothetical protein EOO63_11080, partial [Hymenobacter sp.]
MQLVTLRQLATRSALLLSLGLAAGSCNKATDVQPSNSLDSSGGYATRDDAMAGLLGAYDALQSSDYNGLAYPSMAGLISGEIRFVGTFTTTYGVIGQNQALPDNIQIGNTWNIIYNGINRVNYLLQQTDRINDPAFTAKTRIIAEARALRAYHYMNLIGFWGGSPQGFGYTGGLGVPLRLTPSTSTGAEVAPIARSSEDDIAKAIREDLDFAIANLTVGTGSRINKNAALALRARFELRMRNYASALSFAQQVPAISGFATADATGTSAPDAIWQLSFSNVDQSQYAFYWYPSPGGRNEFDPSTALINAHAANDRRRAINAVTTATTATVGGNQYTLAVGTSMVVRS